MFGKIKNKLKNVFEKSEEIIEDEEDIVEDEVSKREDIDVIDEKEPKKKGFFSKVFAKKDEEEIEELEQLEDEMLEEVPVEEKVAIKEHKKLDKKTVKKNKEKLEKNIIKEEILETQVMNDIDANKKIESEELKEEVIVEEKKGIFRKTADKLKSKKINEDDFSKIWIELEIFLLEINIAFEIVEKIESKLREELIGNNFNRFKLSEKIREVLTSQVEDVLVSREADFLEKVQEIKESGEVVKILVLGVNGTGKTTSIAKIINYLKKNNLSVVVAASDTFRAAAIEQLAEHCEKLKTKLISHKGGSDPAAVAFDAVEHCQAKKVDVLLIDTAGRMPNNSNLMMELQKVKRVSKSQFAIFIGDSIAGNDLIDQIELFDKGVEIDGIILTKVDTDEKPGSIVTTAYAIEKPIYFLGVGQTYDDLIKFDAKEIAEKLFSLDDED